MIDCYLEENPTTTPTMSDQTPNTSSNSNNNSNSNMNSSIPLLLLLLLIHQTMLLLLLMLIIPIAIRILVSSSLELCLGGMPHKDYCTCFDSTPTAATIGCHKKRTTKENSHSHPSEITITDTPLQHHSKKKNINIKNNAQTCCSCGVGREIKEKQGFYRIYIFDTLL